MTLRIKRLFEDNAANQRTALVAYLTIGYPSVEDSLLCARAALAAGADILELGVPFSDPTADGPTIAAASYEAIQRGGSLRAALDIASILRRESDAEGTNKVLIVFTYCNPIFAFGERVLPPAAKAAGVDGLLVVDLPPEEGFELRFSCAEHGVSVIPLLAPTSDTQREKAAFGGATGFVYYVSMTGVTGSKTVDAEGAGRAARALKLRSPLPVVVGFGIDSAAKAREVADYGVDGVVVGSQIVRIMGTHPTPEARAAAVGRFVAELRRALDA